MGSVPAFAYWAIGVVLLLVIAQMDSKIGGWLLLVTVLGLLTNANRRGMI